jgi:PAS domain
MNRMDFQIEHASLRRLHASWIEKRRDRRFPARADFDPLELGFVLGNLSLIDVLPAAVPPSPARHDGGVAARLRPHGKSAEEIPDPEFRQVALDTYRKVVELGQPMRDVRETMLDSKIHRYEIIWLPLSDDDKTINMLMACVAVF